MPQCATPDAWMSIDLTIKNIAGRAVNCRIAVLPYRRIPPLTLHSP
jgi:hypothetical protein